MLPAVELELDVMAEDAERESGGPGSCSDVAAADSMAAVTECDLRLEEEEEEDVVVLLCAYALWWPLWPVSVCLSPGASSPGRSGSEGAMVTCSPSRGVQAGD
jgi:hypothetical protein